MILALAGLMTPAVGVVSATSDECTADDFDETHSSSLPFEADASISGHGQEDGWWFLPGHVCQPSHFPVIVDIAGGFAASPEYSPCGPVLPQTEESTESCPVYPLTSARLVITLFAFISCTRVTVSFYSQTSGGTVELGAEYERTREEWALGVVVFDWSTTNSNRAVHKVGQVVAPNNCRIDGGLAVTTWAKVVYNHEIDDEVVARAGIWA